MLTTLDGPTCSHRCQSQTLVEKRNFCTLPAFDAPVRRLPVGTLPVPFGIDKVDSCGYWLPDGNCYAYPHTNNGKNCSPKFYLYSFAYFTAQTDSRRPVRIPPHWINHCCSHISCTQLPSFLLIIRIYVVIGLDFSKAFDIVRYKTLLEKL